MEDQMYYTIGQVSELTGLDATTLRYYDSCGLFPCLERVHGRRRFTERELEAIRVIQCLKNAGVKIREIRHFMDLCAQGPDTYKERRDFFVAQTKAAAEELEKLQRSYNLLIYKTWYYETALAEGSEKRIQTSDPANMPEDIRKAYLDSPLWLPCFLPTDGSGDAAAEDS